MSDHSAAEEKSDLAGRLGWLVAGAAIGAAVALLFAPQSGKHTRKAISRTAARGLEAVEETGKDLMGSSRDVFDRGKRLVQEATELFERGRKLVRG